MAEIAPLAIGYKTDHTGVFFGWSISRDLIKYTQYLPLTPEEIAFRKGPKQTSTELVVQELLKYFNGILPSNYPIVEGRAFVIWQSEVDEPVAKGNLRATHSQTD